MGYYIDIEPRKPDGLTLQELDQRFLDEGCYPSPAREDAPNIPEDKRELYAHQFWIDLGTLYLHTSSETGLPVGHVRVSWDTHPDDFREDLMEFLRIAEQVGVKVMEFEIGVVTYENLSEVVERFTNGAGGIRKFLGGTTPTRSSSPEENLSDFGQLIQEKINTCNP